jgi:hypothetical protein
MSNIWHTSNTHKLIFASPLVKQKQKNESKKHKFTVMGETIAFSICNKSFVSLGIPSGQVKSFEGLPTPTNFFF